jgi:hypothetical protein
MDSTLSAHIVNSCPVHQCFCTRNTFIDRRIDSYRLLAAHVSSGRFCKTETVHRFAAAGDNFSKALDCFGAFVKIWSAKMVTA